MLKQPNSAQCFACGLENTYGLNLTFYSDGPDKVVCNPVIPDHYQGYPGVVHGGIVASMLDEIVVRVFMSADPNRFMYTAKLTTRFRHPVPTVKRLQLIGTIIKDRGRRAESKAELFGPDGTLLADAKALVVALPEEVMQSTSLDQLG
ncbi:MAG: PaaI family thioesterase, partial [Chloroflexota bacterium]